MRVYRIKVNRLVNCAIHQAANGNILQVTFLVDNGRGCPVSSTIGGLEDVKRLDKKLREAAVHHIDLMDGWKHHQPGGYQVQAKPR